MLISVSIFKLPYPKRPAGSLQSSLFQVQTCGTVHQFLILPQVYDSIKKKSIINL